MHRPRLDALDRRIVGLALPALATLVVEPLYTITDTAIVGHLGRAQLGGLALATTVLNLIGWTSAFLEMATTSRVAFRRGQQDEAGTAAAAAAAYAVALAVGVLVASLVAFAGPPVAHGLGGHGAIQHNATVYLRISAIGMPFLLMTFAGTGHLQGHEDTRTPLRIVLIANIVNVVLEVVLVYGAHTGVAGSAWGTVVAQVVAAALFLRAGRRRIAKIARPPTSEVLLLLRNGWALDIDEAALVGTRCLRLGLIVSAIVAIGTIALSPALPYVFTGDSTVRHIATFGLIVCGALQPFAALAFVYDGLLLGASDYTTLRRSMLLALLAFAPLATATLAYHPLGITGIWLALTCWVAARSALLGRRWASRGWAVAAQGRTAPISPGTNTSS